MKRILFFLSIAVLMTACGGKDKINFTESDLIGTWAHVKSVNAYGDVSENLQVTIVLTANHELVEYFSSTYDTGTWELNGREFSSGEDKATITQLDGTHLVMTRQAKEGTYTDTYFKMESLMVGTWTISWTLGTSQYASFNANGTSSWQNAISGQDMGTPNWTVGVDEHWCRPAIIYSGSGWDEKDTIMRIEENGNLLRAIDINGTSGNYVRGHLTIQ